MAVEPNSVEQVVSRTLRDNLEKIQRTADELHQAVNDMVSACASSRASNALPSDGARPDSAAALSATLGSPLPICYRRATAPDAHAV